MKQENEFVIPEKWCVKGCKELSEYFTEFGLNNRKNKQRSDILYPLGGDCEDRYYYKIQYPSWDYDRQPKGIEITFEQFKEHLLKEIPKPEYNPKDVAFNQRKVVGYKLIKPEYKEAVRAIINDNNWFDNWFDVFQNDKYFNFAFEPNMESKSGRNSVHTILTKADVMHWFEEVYEKESITLKSGVKLSEDDIAEVKEILNNK